MPLRPEKNHTRPPPPSRALLALEGRAVLELGLFFRSLPLLRLTPRGDGHPVLVLPGFMASDRSTTLLRRFLSDRGYEPHGWGLGRNLGYSTELELHMLRRLDALHWRRGRRVSVIGWSLGGIYARELARHRPHALRQVITLGSPFSGSPRASNVWRLYERVSGDTLDRIEAEMMEGLRPPPPVPCTAVYSKSDGIVSWRTCLEEEGPLTDNVQVPGSHCGLGHNPWALYVVADRLTLPADRWTPFRPRLPVSLMFPGRPAGRNRRGPAGSGSPELSVA